MIWIFLIPFLLLPQIGCWGTKKTGPKQSPLAVVNGEAIYPEHLIESIKTEQWKFGVENKSLDEGDWTQIKQEVLETIIKNQLLSQEAKERNIEVSEKEISAELEIFRKQYQNDASLEKTLETRGSNLEQWKQKRKEQLLLKKFSESFGEEMEISEEDLKNHYRQNQSEFFHPEQIRVRQIVTDTPEKAEKLRQKIIDGEDFATLAQSYSLSPDRQQGGDLGYFSHGIMPQAFDEACFPLKKNEISPVTKTVYGYHIFQLVDQKPAETVSFEQAKEKITTQLKKIRGNERFQEWYTEFRKTARVEVDSVALNALLNKTNEKL